MVGNPDIERLTNQLPLLQMIHAQLDKGSDSIVSDPDIFHILVPNPLYDTQPVHTTLLQIIEERAGIYLELIDLQSRMAEAGMTRVKTLAAMYDFYVRDILDKNEGFARMDIFQQASDVSLMFVINMSQIKFVKAMTGEDDERHRRLEVRLRRQGAQLTEFQAVTIPHIEKLVYKDPGEVTEMQRLTYLTQYEMTALDIADYNIALANLTGRLLENAARARYYWQNSLVMLDGHKSRKNFTPIEDLQHDAEIQKIYLERCVILLNRAIMVYQLAETVQAMHEMAPTVWHKA